MINSFNFSFAIFDRCDLPNVNVGILEIDQPGLFAQGPDEKKALVGFRSVSYTPLKLPNNLRVVIRGVRWCGAKKKK